MKAEIKTEMDGRIQHLAVAWLEGTATPAEVEELWEWVKQSEAHYRQLVGLQKEWIRVGREAAGGFITGKAQTPAFASSRLGGSRDVVAGWRWLVVDAAGCCGTGGEWGGITDCAGQQQGGAGVGDE